MLDLQRSVLPGLVAHSRLAAHVACDLLLAEKLDYIPRGANSGSAGWDVLLNCLCIIPVQGVFEIGEFGQRAKMFSQLGAQLYYCEGVLRKVQRQLADEKCKQGAYEQEPLLSCVMRSAHAASNSLVKCS